MKMFGEGRWGRGEKEICDEDFHTSTIIDFHMIYEVS